MTSIPTTSIYSVLSAIVLLASCGGGGSGDTAPPVTSGNPPCTFDPKPFLNGARTTEATSVWQCTGTGVSPFDFLAFEDGSGYSSGVGDFRWRSSACGQISIDASVPQTISQISVNVAAGTGAFLAQQANGSVPTLCTRAASKPAPRREQSATYDSARNQTIIFGGIVEVKVHGSNTTVGRQLSDTWLYSAGQWRQITTASTPSASLGMQMTFDRRRNLAVLVASPAGSTTVETWEFDGAAWMRNRTASAPPARRDHKLAFDSTRQVTVLYGGTGLSGSPFYYDTWEFNGSDWTLKASCTPPCSNAPATSPNQTAMTFSGALGRTVLVGANGSNATGTWTWDGAAWRVLASGTPSSPPSFPALTFDNIRSRLVLSTPALWEFDGTQWVNRSLGAQLPSGVTALTLGSSLVFDESMGKTLIFAGFSGATFSNELLTWDGLNFGR